MTFTAEFRSKYKERCKRDKLCLECGQPATPNRTKCAQCALEANNRSKASHHKIFLAILNAYGGKCACCGINEPTFLTVDHIDGGGEKHRRNVGEGTHFYKWIVKNNFPKSLQLLCANCNTSKMRNRHCIHIR